MSLVLIVFRLLFVVIALSVLAVLAVLIRRIFLVISRAFILRLASSKVAALFLLHVTDFILIKIDFGPELICYLL